MSNTPIKYSSGACVNGAIHLAPAMILIALSSLLLVSCDGGIFSNADWQASGLQNQQLHVLQVGKKDSNALYAGNAQGHIFVSTDAGRSWIEQSRGLPLPDTIHALSFDGSGQKLYAATAKGLFTKTEGTTLWSKVTASGLPPTDITSLAFLPAAPEVIYVGTSDQGVFISNNGGISWLAANNDLPQKIGVNELSFDSVENQLWAATSAGAYRSNNRGASWRSFNTGLPSAILINTVEAAADSGGVPGMVYMGTNHGLFLSHDSGAHWTTNAEALSGVTIYQILLDFRASNDTSVYVATNLGAFHSTDSGQNWQSVAAGLPKNAPVYTLVFGATNNTQLYAASNGLYEFPGTGSSVDPTRIITYIVVAGFFFLLYRLGTRGRSTRRNILKPERIQGATSSTSPENPAPPA